MLGDGFSRNLMIFADEVLHELRVGPLGDDDLNPIAGRQDHRFGSVSLFQQRRECCTDFVGRKSETLADFYRSCLMADADQCEFHTLQG